MLNPLTNHPTILDFSAAVERFGESLNIAQTTQGEQELEQALRNGVIKAFELCFDLAWKSIKVYAAHQGVECQSPRACIRTAFQVKLIDHDERWLTMIDDRNKAVHIYKEALAKELYNILPIYLDLFRSLDQRLEKEAQ